MSSRHTAVLGSDAHTPRHRMPCAPASACPPSAPGRRRRNELLLRRRRQKPLSDAGAFCLQQHLQAIYFLQGQAVPRLFPKGRLVHSTYLEYHSFPQRTFRCLKCRVSHTHTHTRREEIFHRLADSPGGHTSQGRVRAKSRARVSIRAPTYIAGAHTRLTVSLLASPRI